MVPILEVWLLILKMRAIMLFLNGAKMWISNAPYAQVAVVWAKDESGEIYGVIVGERYGRIYNSGYTW